MPGQSNVTALRYLGLGLELAAAIAVGAGGGWLIDRTFATAPWGLLGGALLGVAVGLTQLIRRALAATRGGG